jgi:hypothetical protein
MLIPEQRKYYKLFTGSNQTQGTDKIYLGYEGYSSELILKKDTETYFHIPFFTSSILLRDSTLIADGAIPGPIPALADRIFKKQSEYGKTTPWGTTTQVPDGSWLCSWLYAVSGGEPQWLDRYYNPGTLSIKEALEEGVSIYTYVPSDTLFYDIPSEMTLDSGVYYYYQHQGEKTAKELIQTFGGLDSSRLRLNLENWSNEFEDDTIYKNKTTIDNFNSAWTFTLSSNEYADRNILNFDNTDYIACRTAYTDTYNLSSEFTLSFWFYNKDWSNASYTQLVGNINRGGYGVYYNNLKDYPYWVLPESALGHLFFINQENNIYIEKNTRFQLDTPMQITFAGINLDNEIIVLDQFSNKILKYNHLGDIIDSATTIGSPKTAIINGENNTTILTTSGTFVYDPSLTLIETNSAAPYISNENLAYTPDGVLVRQLSSLDVKYDLYNNKWHIGVNGILYCNDILHTRFLGTSGVNLAVDPQNNLWATTTNNQVYKFDTFAKELIEIYGFGTAIIQTAPKKITFAYNYNRTTNTGSWSGYIINSFEQKMYQFNLEGDLIKIFDLPLELDINNPITAAQDTNDLRFMSTGDYSGYELRRIFYPLLYDNKHQLQFKIMAKHRTERKPDINFTLSIPVNYFANQSWHLATCVYQNQELDLYIDGVLRKQQNLPTNYEITYTYKNDFFIGTPPGKTESLNYEINSTGVIWNGYIDGIRIHDYAVNENFIQTFLREKIIAQNITWNIPTAPLQYIEGIERMFKHRLPGHKSPFFKIKISNTKITDPAARSRAEKEIISLVERIKPVYSKLLSVEWLD